MFAGMEEEFYECLEENFRNEENYKIVKSLIDELSEVGVDDERLKSYYKTNFGSKYEKDTGLVEFLMTMIRMGSSFMERFDFDFEFDEYARALIFTSVEPFIHKKLEVSDSLLEICSEELVAFYLQKNGVELSEDEYFFILGYTTHSDLHNFVSSLKSIGSLEYSVKNNESKTVNNSNGHDQTDKDNDDTKSSEGENEDELEALDDIDIEDIEENGNGVSSEQEVSPSSENSEDGGDEEDDFSDLDDMFEEEDDDEDDNSIDVEVEEDDSENGEKEKEAEKSFEELFGE